MDLKNLDIELNPEYTTMKRVKGKLYLSQEQMDILKSYDVDYSRFDNLQSLILELEELVNEVDDDILLNLLDLLSERDYYENYKNSILIINKNML